MMATETEQKVKTKVQLPRALTLVIIMPWILLMVGFGFFLIGQKMFHPAPQEPAIVKPGQAYSLKEFVVNLADKSGDRHLKMTVVLQLANGVNEGDIKVYEPKLRYLILSNLRSKKVVDISGSNGLEALRYQLKSVINRVVPENKVYDVLITDCIHD